MWRVSCGNKYFPSIDGIFGLFSSLLSIMHRLTPPQGKTHYHSKKPNNSVDSLTSAAKSYASDEPS